MRLLAFMLFVLAAVPAWGQRNPGLSPVNQKMLKLLTEGAPFPDDIKKLVAEGADLNVPVDLSFNGRCPLYFLYISSHSRREFPDPRIVKVLLESGADPKATCSENDTTVLMAMLEWSGYRKQGDDVEIFNLFLAAGADPNASSKGGNIFSARSLPSPEIAKVLIKAGAKVDVAGQDGHSVLFRSVAGYRGIELFKVLYDAGARFTEKDNSVPQDQYGRGSMTVMMAWAASSKDPAFGKLLLESGAKIKGDDGKVIRDSKGWTPLTYLISTNRGGRSGGTREMREAISFLLAQGIALEERTLDGYTPLMMAIKGDGSMGSSSHPNTSAILALLELGADLYAPYSQTALDMLKYKMGNDNLVRAYLKPEGQ